MVWCLAWCSACYLLVPPQVCLLALLHSSIFLRHLWAQFLFDLLEKANGPSQEKQAVYQNGVKDEERVRMYHKRSETTSRNQVIVEGKRRDHCSDSQLQDGEGCEDRKLLKCGASLALECSERVCDSALLVCGSNFAPPSTLFAMSPLCSFQWTLTALQTKLIPGCKSLRQLCSSSEVDAFCWKKGLTDSIQ